MSDDFMVAHAREVLEASGVEGTATPLGGESYLVRVMIQKREILNTDDARGEYAELWCCVADLSPVELGDGFTVDGETWTVRPAPGQAVLRYSGGFVVLGCQLSGSVRKGAVK